MARSAGLAIAAACLTLACTAGQPADAPALDLAAAVASRQRMLATVTGATPTPDVSAELRGRYVAAEGDEVVELFAAEDGLALRMAGIAAAPVRSDGGSLGVWIPAGDDLAVESIGVDGDELSFRGKLWRRDHGPRPSAPDAAIEQVLGRYESDLDGSSLFLDVLEWEGDLWLQVNDVFLSRVEYSPKELASLDSFMGLELAVVWGETWGGPAAMAIRDVNSEARILFFRTFGVHQGPTFKIEPAMPIEELREAAMVASPPKEEGELRDPDLVELVTLAPGIRLDIRYATTNNFMGAVFYEQPRAFLQRPAAEALARVQRRLAEQGYGLLVYDAYRPWFATKMFWDATPEDQKQFVADPAKGSRHNRGCAVDLTLVDLMTGEAVDMTGGYDEFTERSYPFYPGGTDRQRWHRKLLRRTMEAERFAVYEYEWWHFDFHEWAEYPILDRSFDSLNDAE